MSWLYSVSQSGEKNLVWTAYIRGRGTDLEVLCWDEIVTPGDVVQVGKSTVGSVSMKENGGPGKILPWGSSQDGDKDCGELHVA
tara:strand:+ start:757 stop:1008 length:252 start_codon:yes stop_codon:yes gene_type:complete